MMSVNLAQNQQDLSSTWKRITQNDRTELWALFGYEGSTNAIKLMSSGSGGLNELVQELHCSLIQYALCRIIDSSHGINKLILINWQGESAPLTRKGLCASHLSDVSNYFKGCNQTLTLRNEDEKSVEYIMEQVRKCSQRITLSSQSQPKVLKNSQNLIPLNKESPSSNMQSKFEVAEELSVARKSFWEKQEQEEKQRIGEEKKRAAEKQAQYDKERKLCQAVEAKKLSETFRIREHIIDTTRQADKPHLPINITMQSTQKMNDEDERVGRRSEIIRLERDQETSTLISKGSLRDRRAIFEQACSQQSFSNGTTKKSGVSRQSSNNSIVSQRLDTFQSSNFNNPNPRNKIQIDNNHKSIPIEVVSRRLDSIKLVNEDAEVRECTVNNISSDDGSKEEYDADISSNNNNNSIEKVNNKGHIDSIITAQHDSNPIKQSEVSEDLEVNPLMNDSKGTCAKALFDYQAADETEISFDPDDLIGHIEKVDQGWWNGKVLTGAFAGQVGLFPSNYVKEL